VPGSDEVLGDRIEVGELLGEAEQGPRIVELLAGEVRVLGLRL